MILPLQPTDVPGVYRRSSKFVVIHRAEGRQRKQAADTLAEAKAVKLRRDGEARRCTSSACPGWIATRAAGVTGVRANTRREYRRLLINFALTYFDREVRVRDLDHAAVQHFVDWLTTRPGRDGRLCDRLIANALTPLRLALDAAVAEGLLDTNPAKDVVLPRRRAGRAWSMRERRYLTRGELTRLLDEVPAKWRSLFELLAATGLRISEAIGLRWSDLVLDGRRRSCRCAARSSRARDRRAQVSPRRTAHRVHARVGRAVLRAYRPGGAADDAFVFAGRNGAAADYRVRPSNSPSRRTESGTATMAHNRCPRSSHRCTSTTTRTKRELARVAGKELPGAARRRHAGRPRERSRCADRH